MSSVEFNPHLPRQEIEPAAIYGSDGPIRLHIATGGAGQTGLLKALAEAFIEHSRKGNTPHFRTAWIVTDTSLSFNALATGAADVSIVYHPHAVKLAIQQGITTRTEYAWRDHFLLVGPESNPASLPTTGTHSIQSLFAKIFLAATSTQRSPNPVRFLSRYDKSANNIRESSIWTSIGQTPWAEPYSHWYHRYIDFPVAALKAASRLGEYTIVDRGTWYAVGKEGKMGLKSYKEAFDAAEDDALINPAHVLVGTRARDTKLAEQFADWLISADGGQKVVETYAVDGIVLHSKAPKGVTGFERWGGQPSNPQKKH